MTIDIPYCVYRKVYTNSIGYTPRSSQLSAVLTEVTAYSVSHCLLYWKIFRTQARGGKRIRKPSMQTRNLPNNSNSNRPCGACRGYTSYNVNLPHRPSPASTRYACCLRGLAAARAVAQRMGTCHLLILVMAPAAWIPCDCNHLCDWNHRAHTSHFAGPQT